MEIMGKPDTYGHPPLRETLCEQPLVTTEVKILSDELLKIFFAFDLPHERPGGVSSTRSAGIQVADLALPFRIEEVVERTDFSWLQQIGIVPNHLGKVGLKAVDESFGVVDPQMTAPPLFRIFYFGKHQPWFYRIENAFVQHARNYRRRTADVDIEIAHAGLKFVRHAAHRRTTTRGVSLDFDAVPFFELFFDLPFHFIAGGK